MARPRAFDESDVIEAAMLAFWRVGYGATSISTLEKATGLSRVSIYNAFGDKEGLFLRALEHYRAMANSFFNDAFIAGGHDSIITMFESFGDDLPQDAPQHLGCLMVNTTLGVGTASERVRASVQQCRNEMLDAFSSAQRVSRDDADLPSDETIHNRSEFLIAAMWGCRVTVRLEGSTTAGSGIAATVVETVRRW